MSRREPKKKKDFNPKTQKTAKRLEDPGIYDRMNFSWRVSNKYIDYDNNKIGWDKVPILSFLKRIVQALHGYEGQTWQEVRCKDHCHPWELGQIPKEFYDRLQERHIDVDELFQISLGNKPRIFGNKLGKYFYLIWYDKDHKFWPTEPS